MSISSSGSSAAALHSKPQGSNRAILRIAERPAHTASHSGARPTPKAVTGPSPVMTTDRDMRRIV